MGPHPFNYWRIHRTPDESLFCELWLAFEYETHNCALDFGHIEDKRILQPPLVQHLFRVMPDRVWMIWGPNYLVVGLTPELWAWLEPELRDIVNKYYPELPTQKELFEHLPQAA